MISLKKRNEGFTIVELLIVIVVIGILAALVITTYSGIQEKARNTERTTDLKAVQSHLETYFAINGFYPTSSATTGLGSDSAENVTFIGANMKGLDKEALRDPQAATGDYSLSTSATPSKEYSYIPTVDGTTACDNAAPATYCLKYKLIDTPEGGTTQQEVDSLN